MSAASTEGRLDGKVAVVTGGSSGVGEAIVHRFGREGCRVAFCARTTEPGIAVQEAVKAGRRGRLLPRDVTDEADVGRFVAFATERYGGLDILVANAGSALPSPWRDEPTSEWSATIHVDLDGVMFVCREARRHLISRGGGSVLVV